MVNLSISWAALEGQRVLISGGTGFVGKRVLELAISQNIELHSLSRSKGELPSVNYHQVDLTDKPAITELIQTIAPSVVIHLAASGVRYGSDSIEVAVQNNVLGLMNLLLAATQLPGAPIVTITGSWFEYASQNRPLAETDLTYSTSPYSVSKTMATLLAGHFAGKLPITVLRLFSVFGAGETLPRLLPYLFQCSSENQIAELTAGEQIRDFIYIDDVAEGIWRSVLQPAQGNKLRILNLGTGSGVSLHGFVEVVQQQLADIGKTLHVQFGAKPYRPDENMYAVADCTLLQQELGWKPTLSVAEGLSRTLKLLSNT